jgi:hypothetical protein
MNIVPNKSLLEIIQLFVSILFPIVTISGVVVAVIAIRVSKRSQHEVHAIRAYLDYLRMALDHPEFAYPARVGRGLLEALPCVRTLTPYSAFTQCFRSAPRQLHPNNERKCWLVAKHCLQSCATSGAFVRVLRVRFET